jgi:hypothetical protein
MHGTNVPRRMWDDYRGSIGIWEKGETITAASRTCPPQGGDRPGHGGFFLADAQVRQSWGIGKTRLTGSTGLYATSWARFAFRSFRQPQHLHNVLRVGQGRTWGFLGGRKTGSYTLAVAADFPHTPLFSRVPFSSIRVKSARFASHFWCGFSPVFKGVGNTLDSLGPVCRIYKLSHVTTCPNGARSTDRKIFYLPAIASLTRDSRYTV